MYKVGITGTIASGKTSVSILLRRRGFRVFNADQYAHTALHNGSTCFDQLLSVLGKEVLGEDGDIDRRKMAEMIFRNEDLRKKVNVVVHPYVKTGMRRFFSHQSGDISFAEVPLLFEAGWQDEFDEVCVVTCEKETAAARMMEDRGYTREEAERRYVSQISPQKQISQADTVIHNDGTLRQLDEKVGEWIEEMKGRI